MGVRVLPRLLALVLVPALARAAAESGGSEADVGVVRLMPQRSRRALLSGFR